MRIRLFNALVLTMDTDMEAFKGEIWVNDDRIEKVVKGDGNPVQPFDREIDCKGNLLMPGFKDAHTHTAMVLLRSMADDLPLEKWLNQEIFPREARFGAYEVYQGTRLGILEYLTSGITACMDMYLDMDATAEACMDLGMRCVLVGGLNNFSQSLDYIEEMYHKYNGGSGKKSLISSVIGFHAEYTCSDELMAGISKLASRLGSPVFTHIAETAPEVQGSFERHGMSPLAYLDSIGMFEHGGGGYHLVHTDEGDREILKKRGMYVVSNPASNLKLASGIAPISDYMRDGIPVALGTDGASSNNCLDMFREMFLVTGLAKYREDDACAVDALEVLRMATVNGAGAMGLNDCDILSEGKKADIIMLDLGRPNMRPLNNVLKNIVYSGSKDNVKMTMIDGEILYMNGEFFINGDVEDIYAKNEEIKDRIKNI